MVLEKSSVQPDIKATKPGTDEQVNLSDLSVSGGLINAYDAAKLAQQVTSQQKMKPVKTKMKVKKSKSA